MPQGEIDPRKVAIYIRWSTEDQAEGTTLEVQREGCESYAHSQGWLVSPNLIFIDDGYSGGSLARPAMDRLRQAVTQGLVDCVVVFKIDRLSRNVVDMVKLVLDEWDGLCHLKSAREPIDTASPSGRMFFYQLMSFAEWERTTIRDRMFAGKLRRAAQGQNPGHRAPYGYRWNQDRKLEVVPEQAAIVRRIFHAYLAGAGQNAIAEALNRDRIPFRGGGPWSASTIAKMLANPVYKGNYQFGCKQVNPNKGRRLHEPWYLPREKPLVSLKGQVPAIIPVADFLAAQAMRSAKRPRFGGEGGRNCARGRNYTSPYLLTGIARCDHCGSAICGRPGRTGPYYFCKGRAEHGRSFCPSVFIQAGPVDAAFVHLLRHWHGRGVEGTFLKGWERDVRQQMAEQERRLAELAVEADNLDRQLHDLRSLLRTGQLSAADFTQLKGDVEAEVRALQRRRSDLEAALAALGGLAKQRRLMAETLNKVGAWESLALPEQKHVIRQLATVVRLFRAPYMGETYLHVTWRSNSGDGEEVTTRIKGLKRQPQPRRSDGA